MIKEMEMKVAGCVFSWRHVINTLNGATVVAAVAAAVAAAAAAVAVAIIVTQFHAQYSWWIQMNSKKETVAYKQQTTHCHQHNANWRIGYIHWALLFVSHSQRSKVDISFKMMTEFWNMHKRQQERQKKPKKSRLSYRQPTDDTLHWLIIASWLSKFHCCSFYLLLLAPLLNRGDDKGLGGATVSTCADSICRRLARSSPHPFQIWRPWRPARWLARKAKKKSAGKKTRPAFFYPPETRMAAHKRNSDENKSEE